MQEQNSYRYYTKVYNTFVDELGIEPDKYEREDAFFGIITDVENGINEKEAIIKAFDLVHSVDINEETYDTCMKKCTG